MGKIKKQLDKIKGNEIQIPIIESNDTSIYGIELHNIEQSNNMAEGTKSHKSTNTDNSTNTSTPNTKIKPQQAETVTNRKVNGKVNGKEKTDIITIELFDQAWLDKTLPGKPLSDKKSRQAKSKSKLSDNKGSRKTIIKSISDFFVKLF